MESQAWLEPTAYTIEERLHLSAGLGHGSRERAFAFDLARFRRILPERQVILTQYLVEEIDEGSGTLGIITCGISYQHAKEVFPTASILRLGMTWPLPENLIRQFAATWG